MRKTLVCNDPKCSYQVANAVVRMVGYRECDAELGQPNEEGSEGQRVDQVQVVGVASRQYQCSQCKR